MNAHITGRGPKDKRTGKRGAPYAIVLEMGDDASGKRQQRWVSGYKTKTEAQNDMIRMLRELQTGEFIEPSKLTVGEWFTKWEKDYSSDLATGTKRLYGIVIASAREHVEHIKLQSVRNVTLQPMFSEWEKRYSPSTMQTRRTCLGSIFGVAVEMGYLRVNPAKGIKLPKVEHHDPAYLSEDQIRILFGVLEGTKYLLPTIIAAHTGMRRGEVLGLTWDKVLWEQKALIVNASLEEGSNRIKATKTQRGALVPVSDDLLAELKRHKAVQDAERLQLGTRWQNRNLVVAREDGGPLTPTALSQGFRKYATKAGLDITFHGLRHSHASLLLLKGIHMKVVQERLRHSSMGITSNLYSHVAPTMQREAAEMTTGLQANGQKVVGIR